MKKIKQIVLAILIGTTLITSCQKEGCTDRDAENFSSEAKSDDGTCTYESSFVFYYDGTTAQNLIDDGATNLTFYLDGNIIGSSSASVYWTNEPDCGSNGSITVTKPLGGVKNKTYSYRVIDQTGWEYWSGNLNFEANTCTSLELYF